MKERKQAETEASPKDTMRITGRSADVFKLEREAALIMLPLFMNGVYIRHKDPWLDPSMN